ncbi:hypothetical protein K7X08_013870 [Anisodus acutangulus]|uniref:tryptophan--tRNA ligase n=1 Tax=Anisodus acutangulus TaxID=402998 RepID=A0A9Q1R2K1_9SOLA|nr:hypothetical protein K7X08_013870 [Anisodus acutangulus]
MITNSAPHFASSTRSCGLSVELIRQYPLQGGRDLLCLCSNVAVSEPVNSETSSSPVKKRIVSGVQPTGSIHLGNYLGAIKNWIRLQDTYETFFFIVDLHAITLQYDAQQLLKATRDTAAIYLACGVDPSKGDENVGVALLTCPVLMAADILLYQSDLVPVGEDQKQHLELTGELAERVNYLYGGRKWKKLGGRGGAIFNVPEPLIPPTGARIMSLTDGLSKIKWCKTDAFPGLEFDNAERPECCYLLSIYQLVTGKTKQVAEECRDMNWGSFKIVLTDALVDHLHPIQVRYEEIVSDSSYLDEVLAEGARKAADIADVTVNNVYQAMGFLRR